MDTKLFYILNDTVIEYEIRNYCGGNIGTGGNSKFTLLIYCKIFNVRSKHTLLVKTVTPDGNVCNVH